jgi:hypothetical protein
LVTAITKYAKHVQIEVGDTLVMHLTILAYDDCSSILRLMRAGKTLGRGGVRHQLLKNSGIGARLMPILTSVGRRSVFVTAHLLTFFPEENPSRRLKIQDGCVRHRVPIHTTRSPSVSIVHPIENNFSLSPPLRTPSTLLLQLLLHTLLSSITIRPTL